MGKVGNMTVARRQRGRMAFRWMAIVVLTLTCGGGCAGFSPAAKPTTGRNPTLAEVPDKDETVRGDNDPPVVTLEVGSALHERKLEGSDQLPGNIIIPTTNLDAVPVTAALQGVLAGTDIALSWDAGNFANHLVTVMNLSGTLPQVVAKICAAGRVFCAYRNGALELRNNETFIISLPPVASAMSSSAPVSSGASNSSTTSGSSGSSTPGTSGASSPSLSAGLGAAAGNSMADAISRLAGNKAEIDQQGGNIIYTTDVDGEYRVRQYLEQLRNGRPLIVLQLYIWEVTLNKEDSEGINWNSLHAPTLGGHYENLTLSAPASAFSSATSNAATFGAVTAGKISANLLLSFLATQGQVQTISNPQITFVSGSSAQFTVGGKTNYISQVGQLVTASNVSGTSNSSANSSVGTNTVSTASINTGLSIDVNGAYEGGVVFANLALNVTNLVSLNPTTSGGETIDLPETTNREISTVIRVRPGDNLVMAGMVTSQDTNSRQGLPLPGDARLPTYGDTQLKNNELVIMVKPSVVLFSDHDSIEEAKAKENATPLPAAVMIDKNGTRRLDLPGEQPAAPAQAASVAAAAALKPQAGPVPAPNAASVAYVPPATGSDANNAMVNQYLMQRGFSHAFDELLQSPRGSQSTAADSAGAGDKP